jgi:hypothetical protein
VSFAATAFPFRAFSVDRASLSSNSSVTRNSRRATPRCGRPLGLQSTNCLLFRDVNIEYLVHPDELEKGTDRF